MKAIILAAGLGTRLRPITSTTPKCLVPINGVPLLELWLRDCERAGVDAVLVNTHHLAERVEEFVAARRGLPRGDGRVRGRNAGGDGRLAGAVLPRHAHRRRGGAGNC